MQFKEVRDYTEKDLPAMTAIFNEVVRDGMAFPEEDELTVDEARDFFAKQVATRIAVDENDEPVGVYTLHPNYKGRSGHIANASYSVSSACRGQHVGEKLVLDSMQQAEKAGYRILQYNAVVESNVHAQHLYERIGFHKIGYIPGGFRNVNNEYEGMYAYYIDLTEC